MFKPSDPVAEAKTYFAEFNTVSSARTVAAVATAADGGAISTADDESATAVPIDGSGEGASDPASTAADEAVTMDVDVASSGPDAGGGPA